MKREPRCFPWPSKEAKDTWSTERKKKLIPEMLKDEIIQAQWDQWIATMKLIRQAHHFSNTKIPIDIYWLAVEMQERLEELDYNYRSQEANRIKLMLTPKTI